MNRELKFRYTYQHQETGRIMSKCYTLTDIEQGNVFVSSHWTLIARDQYTGLADNNNNDIFEGDILRHATSKYPLGSIEFHDGSFVARWKGGKSFGVLYQRLCRHFTIISNKYEHPELIE